MASPEEVTRLLPDTLPEDFSEWDGDGAGAALPGAGHGPQAVRLAGEALRQPSASAARGAGVAPGVGRPRGVRSTWSGAETAQEVPGSFADQVMRSVSYRLEPNRQSGGPLKPAASGENLLTVEAPVQAAARSLREPERDEQEKPENSATGSSAQIAQRPEAGSVTEISTGPVRAKVITTVEMPKPAGAKAEAMSDAAIVEMFREKPEEEEEQGSVKKKQILIAAAGACVLLLLLLLIPVLHRGAKVSAANALWQSSQPVSGAAETPSELRPAKPSAGTRVAPADAHAAAAVQAPAESSDATLDNAPAVQDAAATSAVQDAVAAPQPSVQPAMMNEQLRAPSKIAHQASPAPVGDAPPPVNLGSYGMGDNGANGGVFAGNGQPAVKVAPSGPIAIASGVANGMLTHKTTPIYPTIAKEARISGTVVLQAVVSTTGTVKNLHVVSGPEMLRQAAMQAVQTWRYTPYRLNNQPVEMETTISVAFDLGG